MSVFPCASEISFVDTFKILACWMINASLSHQLLLNLISPFVHLTSSYCGKNVHLICTQQFIFYLFKNQIDLELLEILKYRIVIRYRSITVA